MSTLATSIYRFTGYGIYLKVCYQFSKNIPYHWGSFMSLEVMMKCMESASI